MDDSENVWHQDTGEKECEGKQLQPSRKIPQKEKQFSHHLLQSGCQYRRETMNALKKYAKVILWLMIECMYVALHFMLYETIYKRVM